MKKFIFIFPFLFTAAHAQTRFEIGVKTGINYLYYVNIDESFDPLCYGRFSRGHSLGISATYRFGPHLSVEMDLFSELKKHQSMAPFPSGIPGLLINHFSCISVPLLARWHPFGNDRLYVSGGFFYTTVTSNYNRYAELEKNYSFFPGARILTHDVTQNDHFRKEDMGMVFGLGRYFHLYKNIELSIEGRTQVGLTDINNKDNLYTTYTGKEVIKTFTPSLLIGFSYKFEGKPGT